MDPNETLRSFREHRAAAEEAADHWGRLAELEAAAEAAGALDVWLSQGGFLPKEWEAVS
jgi:hypothetical protein